MDHLLAHHAADGDALHHPGAAVPRYRELQDVRPGGPADQRLPRLGDRAGLDQAQARGLREVAYRLRLGARHHHVRVDLRSVDGRGELPQQGEAAMRTVPHSPLEPSAGSKWFAGIVVITYAVVSL